MVGAALAAAVLADEELTARAFWTPVAPQCRQGAHWQETPGAKLSQLTRIAGSAIGALVDPDYTALFRPERAFKLLDWPAAGPLATMDQTGATDNQTHASINLMAEVAPPLYGASLPEAGARRACPVVQGPGCAVIGCLAQSARLCKACGLRYCVDCGDESAHMGGCATLRGTVWDVEVHEPGCAVSYFEVRAHSGRSYGDGPAVRHEGPVLRCHADVLAAMVLAADAGKQAEVVSGWQIAAVAGGWLLSPHFVLADGEGTHWECTYQPYGSAPFVADPAVGAFAHAHGVLPLHRLIVGTGYPEEDEVEDGVED